MKAGRKGFENGIAIFPVTARGYRLARACAGRFPGVIVYKPDELKSGGLKKKAAAALESCSGLFFISASGIAVRTCAPFLKGKHLDPAIVVMDDSARFVISLISGHLGGANELAKAIADIYGATPVITTATDGAGLPCVEGLAQSLDCAIDDVRKIKLVNSAILNRARVFVIDKDAVRRKRAEAVFNASGVFTFRGRIPVRIASGDVFVMVTPFTEAAPLVMRRRTLALCPVEFVAGVGCRRGVSAREVGSAIKATLKDAGVSFNALRNLASVDMKKDEAGLLEFAKGAGLEISFYTGPRLNKVKAPSGANAMVKKATGTASVSEAAAILSAGAKRIWLRKRKFKRVTVALARAASA